MRQWMIAAALLPMLGSTALAQETVKIGYIDPLSGGGASVGEVGTILCARGSCDAGSMQTRQQLARFGRPACDAAPSTALQTTGPRFAPRRQQTRRAWQSTARVRP